MIPVLKAKGLSLMLLCVHYLFTQGNLNDTEGADSDFPWCTEIENESHHFKIAVQ